MTKFKTLIKTVPGIMDAMNYSVDGIHKSGRTNLDEMILRANQAAGANTKYVATLNS